MTALLPVRPIGRVLSDEAADALIGDPTPPEAADVNVTGAGVYVDARTGEPVFLYAPLPGDLTAYRAAVRAVPITTTLRGSGTRNASRTFGMASRNVILRRESCRPASLALDRPELHAVLVALADGLRELMEANVPERLAVDRATVAEVGADWRMAPGSVWTSGNINVGSALPYHRDRANYPVWSGMPVLRRGVRGGYLHVPAYDATIACRDGWVVCFDGNRVVHGVTPMEERDPDGYRVSVVYYALRNMKQCLPCDQERAAAAQRRTDRERRMADPDEDPADRITAGIRGTRRPGRTEGDDK